MFQVEWQLNAEEELNPMSLLGQIKLTDSTYSIEEFAVYLDSWFAALLQVAPMASHFY